MAQTFEAFVASERNRIKEAKQALVSQKNDLDRQIAGLDKELAAIEAYESVKSGRTATSSSSGGTRRTGIRDQILAVVKAAPDGISAGDVLKQMDATSDQDKTAVRNALSALKKNNSIGLANGVYSAA